MQQPSNAAIAQTTSHDLNPSLASQRRSRCLLILISLLPILLIANPLVLAWLLSEEVRVERLYILWLDLLVLLMMWLCYRFLRTDRPFYQRAALISLLALPLMLAGSEALLLHFRADYQRLIGEQERPGVSANSVLQRDDRFGWSLRPGASASSPEIVVDQEGLRETPDLAHDAAPTIHVFGDSFLFGQGVDQDKIATHLLAERFEGRANVLNYAVSGYGIEQMALRLEAAASTIKPGDVVIISPITNDLRRNLITKQLVCTHYHEGFASDRFPRWDDGRWRYEALQDHCPELGLPMTKLYGIIKKNLGITERELVANADRILHRVKRLTEARGAAFALVFQPNHKECRKGRFDIDVKALTVPFHDLMHACDDFDPAIDYTLTPADYHWNDNGHRWLADNLGDFLEKKIGI